MTIDSKEQVLITGTKSGEVIVWKNADFECSIDQQGSNSQTLPASDRQNNQSSDAVGGKSV